MSFRIARSLPEPLAAGSNAAFDLSCAPFSVQEGAGPGEVAEQIVACYELARARPDKLTRAVEAMVSILALPADAPLAAAARALANDIDGGAGDGRANPYHNSQHYCEVVLAVCYLAQRASLNTNEQAQLLVAALAHDIHHDGRSTIGKRFRLEWLAVQATVPYLNEAGVSRDEQLRIISLILATEVTIGAPYARQCYAHFFSGARLPPMPEAAAGVPEAAALGALGQDAALTRQAVLLAEADLLPSVGLTVDYGELTQANLAREWGRPMSAADKLHFLDNKFGDFLVSRFFSPNVQTLKDAMRQKSGAMQR